MTIFATYKIRCHDIIKCRNMYSLLRTAWNIGRIQCLIKTTNKKQQNKTGTHEDCDKVSYFKKETNILRLTSILFTWRFLLTT